MANLPEKKGIPQSSRIDTALLGIAFAILVQWGACLWWASNADTRISKLEADIAPVRVILETVARLDERTKGIERIERKLDKSDGRS